MISFSKIISVVLHPLWMPLLVVYLSLNYIPFVKPSIYNNIGAIYLSIFVYSVFLPLISLFVLIKLKILNSLEIFKLRERPLPLFITFFWVSLGLFSLQNILLFVPFLNAALLGCVIIIILSSFVSLFWKISLHMLGMGGVLAVLVGASVLYETRPVLIIFLIFLSGVLGSARLYENAHSSTQIYSGFIVGFLIQLVVLLSY